MNFISAVLSFLTSLYFNIEISQPYIRDDVAKIIYISFEIVLELNFILKNCSNFSKIEREFLLKSCHFPLRTNFVSKICDGIYFVQYITLSSILLYITVLLLIGTCPFNYQYFRF
jgi:hypothetical protein